MMTRGLALFCFSEHEREGLTTLIDRPDTSDASKTRTPKHWIGLQR